MLSSYASVETGYSVQLEAEYISTQLHATKVDVFLKTALMKRDTLTTTDLENVVIKKNTKHNLKPAVPLTASNPFAQKHDNCVIQR